MRTRGTIALALVATLAACAAAPAPAPAPKPGGGLTFKEWVALTRTEMLAKGITARTFDDAFKNVRLNADVMMRNEEQPEFARPIWSYMDGAVSDARVSNGRDKLTVHAKSFARAAKTYAVPAEVIAAIWGLESSYGTVMGDFYIIEALATLAYTGPRTAYGREQLFPALRILQEGDIKPAEMLGSWAGAMGNTQFIPSSYWSFAKDGDGDGKRDLWHSLPDVFASTASYLKESGWRAGEPWGFEVTLPKDFPYAEADTTIVKTVADWTALGVKRIDGRKLTGAGVTAASPAAIFLPAGHRGPAFVVFDNFRVILKYNNSTAYGLAIGHLSDKLKGGGGIIASWPREEPALTRDQRIELQRLLAQKGYDVGEADGILGKQTRAAVRAYQQSVGLVPDGFATLSLLLKLRK